MIAPLLVVATASAGGAAPPPQPLPWQRTYVDERPMTNDDLLANLYFSCSADKERGVYDNGVPGVPKIAVAGDSVDDQLRFPALTDEDHRWVFATHCGEKYWTTLVSGRLSDALAAAPDVLVIGLGANNVTYDFAPAPELLAGALHFFEQTLLATDGVRCRVLLNLPETSSYGDPAADATMLGLIRAMNAAYASVDPTRHPGVHVADWRAVTARAPQLLADDSHVTWAGINARINLMLATARQCFPPDTPQGVRAQAGNQMATAWWDPLPTEEAAGYRVTTSDGRSFTTAQPTLNVGGLANGTPLRFQVTAVNAAGESTPSDWSEVVVPDRPGARFHAVTPTRVLDTRTGVGSPAAALGPGETRLLSLRPALPQAATGSAVVLNVTATGATEPSFVTVWPAGESRPLASNLNPRPDLDALPAMVTSALGPGGAVQLYNSTGRIDLVADVVGWYDAPGAGTGALFTPVAPTRVLDSRDGTGGRATPFGSGDRQVVTLPSLPAGATAAVVNLTATDTTASGFVTAWSGGDTPRPLASNLNPQAGRTRANLTTVAVDPSGTIELFNNTGSTDLVVDLVGAYGPAGAPLGGSEFFPVTAERSVDTRDGTGGHLGPVRNDAPLALALAGRGAVPAADQVAAVDANVTVVGPSAAGHTTLWPSGPRPETSVLNFGTGEVVANRDLVGLAGGTTQVWSASPLIHYVIDVSGWFGPPITPAQAAARQGARARAGPPG
ncbi:MAG: hypothetical protein R2726_01795 [Acidimicrobiales bacterium]